MLPGFENGIGKQLQFSFFISSILTNLCLILQKINEISPMQNSDADNNLVRSFKTLRKLVGILGIALPIVMTVYALAFSPCGNFESSISSYYHTHMRNVLVGILCGVGVFMITYKGYDRRDTIASTLAGIFAISIAMFPTSDPSLCEHNGLINSTIGVIHVLVSGGLFLTFAYMSIWLFTLSADGMTVKKRQRNGFYRACGWIVVACVVLIALHSFAGIFPDSLHPVFWFETIALVFFGISWLIKGEGIKALND